jgi:hypothetical protein
MACSSAVRFISRDVKKLPVMASTINAAPTAAASDNWFLILIDVSFWLLNKIGARRFPMPVVRDDLVRELKRARESDIEGGRTARGDALNRTVTIAKPQTTMPPNKQTEQEFAKSRQGQSRPGLHRYLLQVDRQTSSFDDKAAALKAGKAIKKDHPVVQVSIYDGQGFEREILDA